MALLIINKQSHIGGFAGSQLDLLPTINLTDTHTTTITVDASTTTGPGTDISFISPGHYSVHLDTLQPAVLDLATFPGWDAITHTPYIARVSGSVVNPDRTDPPKPPLFTAESKEKLEKDAKVLETLATTLDMANNGPLLESEEIGKVGKEFALKVASWATGKATEAIAPDVGFAKSVYHSMLFGGGDTRFAASYAPQPCRSDPGHYLRDRFLSALVMKCARPGSADGGLHPRLCPAGP